VAIKILTARRWQTPNARLVFTIHVDTTKLLVDQTPDPAWVISREYTIPATWTGRADRVAYLTNLQAILLSEAQAALLALNEQTANGTVIPALEGQVIG
jgi:hypothetical protein